LDVHSEEKTCELAAKEIIKFVRDWRLTADHFAELTCERAFMWRVRDSWPVPMTFGQPH
jgi:hypothetical protein